ncbi:hypothetical protein C8A01DRAFT_45872 [Parachaetomium inaequale]|uniref:Uncharacterized protein n=1 Tax=Parachaetomium inaequale TaxID=2588326 RepID=A0AAN6SSN7_9PEZI|nr:hypothetical protein C8A01DRAFT_45872 [Parachaetomium inaequale]
MDALAPKKKAKLHEVADLMLEIFNTLARMRYLEPEWIQPGPHDLSTMMPFYASLGLDPSIIYLYSILPYLDPLHASKVDFFGPSDFADFRDEQDVVDGRDPVYAHEPEMAMRPWMTPLSRMRNHRTVLIYDAKRHVVGMFEGESDGSCDPNLYEGVIFQKLDDDGQVLSCFKRREDGTEEECDAPDWDNISDEEDDEEEDEEEEDEDGDGDEDINHWDEMDSRPAGNVLRDIIRWYRELVETPGGGENTAWTWRKELVAPLYRKHGWPGESFDGDAFLADKLRAEAAEAAKKDAEAPERRRIWLERHKEGEAFVMLQRQEKLAAAKTVDEEWVARWEIWQAEQTTRYMQQEAKKAEESISPYGGRQKPEDLPLWELREVQKEFLLAGRGLEELKKASPSPPTPEALRSAEQRLVIYEKAYAASLADAERLCPGRAPFPLHTDTSLLRGRHEELSTMLGELEEECAGIRDWVAQLSDGADEARKLGQNALHEKEERRLSVQKYAEEAWERLSKEQEKARVDAS